MNWINLESQTQLEEISQKSVALIFKHSTRCPISSAALSLLQKKWNDEAMAFLPTYFLDLLRHRDISNKIAEKFEVEHQSPQVLLIKNGKCIYHNSHYGINYDEIKVAVQEAKVLL